MSTSMRRPHLLLTAALAFSWLAVAARMFSAYRLQTPTGPIWAVADDMYISASFARSLVEGDGLRWYAHAPKVEGYSNPMWVMVLAVLHLIPGFDEDLLGLFVAGVNGLIVVLLSVVFVRALIRSGAAQDWRLSRLWLVLLLTLSATLTLCFCVSAGFETGLVALLTVGAFSEALQPPEAVRWKVIAVLLGLAFWTRMDALIYFSAAIVVVVPKLPRERKPLSAAAILVAMICAGFVARRLYYGDWLPNTYYLKATGWPLTDRLAQGLFGSFVPLALLLFVVLPSVAALRVNLTRIVRPVLAALLTYLIALLSSIELGGDFVHIYGQNRFTSVGTVYLAFALVCIVLELPRWRACWYAMVALLVSSGPVWILHNDGATMIGNLLDYRRPPFEPDRLVHFWSTQGKRLREVSEPGARIAVCGAGAVIYFSHRGGVDLLGKVEPLVAHQPVRERATSDSRCWRRFPGAGHNKEDVPLVFEARMPELSLVVPPSAATDRYVRVYYSQIEFYALRGATNVHWDKLAVSD
jgi:hypothetical protein